ncbi:MAG: putative sugar nucleotidyl transferase [Nitrososphaera sp.]|jgi:UDP-N-acetylglucosamine diphosphorylase/glucosamine-1-phosphate N-acetyltransferase
MEIALFEDHHWRNLSPITLTRATFDIKVGARTYFEECIHAGVTPSALLVRDYLAKVTSERHSDCKVNPPDIDGGIFVNGLLHPATLDFARLQQSPDHTFAITYAGRLLVARLSKKSAQYVASCATAGKRIDLKKIDADRTSELKDGSEGVISNLWDIIRVLENSLAIQSAANESSSVNATVMGTASVVCEGAQIEEGTVLDARKGPIYIAPGASIAPSRIVGPTYIGQDAQVKQFSIIESSYIGRSCRVAGEVEHSIISDYSNKAHAGFVGHSYVGEWVNIGAMTTTSDLKMTYGRIKMDALGKKADTGLDKLGSFFADMSKTSIGTLIYSGRKIGTASHLHGLVSDDVPAFSIYGGRRRRNVELEIQSAIETQRKVMPRRGQSMSKAYEQMMKDVFLATAADRKKAGVRKEKFAL